MSKLRRLGEQGAAMLFTTSMWRELLAGLVAALLWGRCPCCAGAGGFSYASSESAHPEADECGGCMGTGRVVWMLLRQVEEVPAVVTIPWHSSPRRRVNPP